MQTTCLAQSIHLYTSLSILQNRLVLSHHIAIALFNHDDLRKGPVSFSPSSFYPH